MNSPIRTIVTAADVLHSRTVSTQFKIVFKTIHLCISWWIKHMILSRCTECTWRFYFGFWKKYL